MRFRVPRGPGVSDVGIPSTERVALAKITGHCPDLLLTELPDPGCKVMRRVHGRPPCHIYRVPSSDYVKFIRGSDIRYNIPIERVEDGALYAIVPRDQPRDRSIFYRVCVTEPDTRMLIVNDAISDFHLPAYIILGELGSALWVGGHLPICAPVLLSSSRPFN